MKIKETVKYFPYTIIELSDEKDWADKRPIFRAVHAENKLNINDQEAEKLRLYFESMPHTSLSQHDIAIYNTWVSQYRPDFSQIEVDVEVICTRTVNINGKFACGCIHLIEKLNFCDSEYKNWGLGEFPERPYIRTYEESELTIDTIGLCPECKSNIELLNRIPWLLVTNDEWSSDLLLLFEDEKDKNLFPWEYNIETLENENTLVDEYWPEHRILCADGEYYIYGKNHINKLGR